MKRPISHLAMAIALSLGAAGAAGVAAPAHAQQMEISKEFQPHAVEIQTAVNGAAENAEIAPASEQALTAVNKLLNARDDASRAAAQAEVDAARGKVDQLMGGVVAKLDAARPTLKTADDKLFFGQMALNVGQKLYDFGLQNEGINYMIESGKLPPEELPKYEFFAGQTAFNAQDYASARTSLQKAVDGGYTQNGAPKLLADAYLRDGQTAEGLVKLKSAVEMTQAAGQPVPEGWAFDGLAAAVNQNQREQAFDWGVLTLETDSRPQARNQAYRIVEAYSPFTDEEQLDLMRLMDREDAMTEERQKLVYLQLIRPLQRPGEAKTFLDDSGSDLPTSNPAVAEASRVASDRYDSVLSELMADSSNASGNAALGTADALLGYGKAAEAAALYQKAVDTGATDKDRALTGLGIALADQGKFAEAKAAFGQISAANRAKLAEIWTAYVDMKAGA